MLRIIKKCILFLSFPLFAWSLDPSDSAHFRNPVIGGDFADPSVIRVGKIYYAVGTSSEWAPHFPVFSSKDLVNWKQGGYVFNKKPEWTLSSFWAPEYFYHNNTFYVYYVARRKTDSISCIGVATSKYPDRGFVDHGVIVEYGREAIDPFIFNDNGQLYMTFKAYGLDKRPIELLGVTLSPDGRKATGKPFMLMRDDPHLGMEGQSLIKKNNYYYLLYSAGACCGSGCSYHVNIARAKSIRGPFEPYSGNPLLNAEAEWKCPGHGTLVTTPEENYYYLYHAYSKKDHVFTGRQGMLKKLLWDDQNGWPYFSAADTAMQDAAADGIKNGLKDDFAGNRLADDWQYDFRNAQPSFALSKGDLFLSGKTESGNATGTALTVRPLSGDYEMTTAVVNTNASLKGLVIYGDAGQSVGIGVTGNTVQVWEVRDGKRKILQQQVFEGTVPLLLKMAVTSGAFCRFFWKQNGDWNELNGSGSAPYDGSHLPPWDRSPRPGLCQYGKIDAPAQFSYFEIVYGSP